MDPLSVAASIAGILGLAIKIGDVLQGVVFTARDAPRVLTSLVCEVQEVRAALSSLEILLAHLSSSQTHRAALIQIDQLITTLTDSVLTFSELETAIIPFDSLQGANMPLRARMRWVRAEDKCRMILERMQRHKATISLMLNILQCTSDEEAKRSQSSMEILVQKLLEDNHRLGRRLRNLEDAFDAMSVITRDLDSSGNMSEEDNATIRSFQPSASRRVSILDAVKMRFAFDEDLQSSRVYRMVHNKECNHSVISSAARTETFSIFSGLSLADISVISVIALPLYPEDIENQREYYQFGQVKPEHFSSTWENQLAVIDESAVGETRDGQQEDDADSMASSSPTAVSDTNPSDVANPGLQTGEQCPSVQIKDLPSSDEALATSLRDLRDWILTYNCDSDDSQSDMEESGYYSAQEYFSDQEYSSYTCKGCGKIMQEGKVYIFDSNYWHIDCLVCSICRHVITTETSVTVLTGGKMICSSCKNGCDRCGKAPTISCVFAAGQLLCKECFECSSCHRKIEDSRYAQTKQGIICITCDKSLRAHFDEYWQLEVK